MRALAALLVLVAIPGCLWTVGADDDDDVASSPTPVCTPPSANDIDVLLHVTDAEAFEGNAIALRLVLDDTVMTCTTALVPASGALDLVDEVLGVVGGLTAELVLSSDASAVHGAGDDTRTFTLDVDGTVTSEGPCSVEEEWTLSFDADTDGNSAVTWPLGEACPL